MSETFFKAARHDGKDFNSGTIDYGAAAKSRTKAGKVVSHPRPRPGVTDAARYLSVATVATDCTGFSWGRDGKTPHLYEVEALGEVWTPHPSNMPNKRAVTSLRIIRELPAHMLFGPEGESIVTIINAYDALTDEQRKALREELNKSYDAFWTAEYAVAYGGRAARAGLYAAQNALGDRLSGGWFVGGGTAYGAALALLCRHLIGKPEGITQKEYNTLSRPWRRVIGPIHTDDKAVR